MPPLLSFPRRVVHTFIVIICKLCFDLIVLILFFCVWGVVNVVKLLMEAQKLIKQQQQKQQK